MHLYSYGLTADPGGDGDVENARLGGWNVPPQTFVRWRQCDVRHKKFPVSFWQPSAQSHFGSGSCVILPGLAVHSVVLPLLIYWQEAKSLPSTLWSTQRPKQSVRTRWQRGALLDSETVRVWGQGSWQVHCKWVISLNSLVRSKWLPNLKRN